MMKKFCCSPQAKDFGLFLLRLTIGIIFIRQGWLKLSGIDGVVAMLDNLGFPIPVIFAYLVAIVEFLGGIALVLGLYTRCAALLLAIVMIVALLIAHIGGPFGQAELPLALLAGTIGIWAGGGGNWKIMKGFSECMCPNSKK
jgi:putative oxidoreductase